MDTPLTVNGQYVQPESKTVSDVHDLDRCTTTTRLNSVTQSVNYILFVYTRWWMNTRCRTAVEL